MMALPYKSTPVFDEISLPAAIRNEHSTKQGVWGLLRVLEGEVRLVFVDCAEAIVVTPERPAQIAPRSVHHVELSGAMRLQVEFYHEQPDEGQIAADFLNNNND